MEVTIVLLYGLLIGSFLNVCIYRIPRGESISFPPSHCAVCDKRLKWYDLFPVFSFVFLRGKCRYCGDKISIKYPAVELFTAVLFCLIYLKYGLTFEFFKFAVLAAILIVIGIIDFETTDVYTKVTVFGIAVGILFLITGYFLYEIGPLDYIIGGIVGGGVIALIVILTKGMGWGDVEICLICGLFIGIKHTVLMLILSFLTGGIIGILLILLGIKSRKDYVPFGPFIAIASLLSILLGDKILNLYFTII
jgi:leader peptidase (prepilin peptidase) / N-methyltransferase